MPKPIEMEAYEVNRWGHKILVSTVFAESELKWRDVIERQLHAAVISHSKAFSAELEDLIDERDQPNFPLELAGRSLHPHWPNFFYVYGVYRVKIPITDA